MVYNQTDDGVYAPEYYNSFKCTADKCKHSCCIDWEICIDEETLAKYRKIDGILDTISECDDGVCFKLTEDGRCPHLNESGLCDIILSHGEDYISEICTKHPRFFNTVNDGRVEAGLGIVCEEACRLILENEKTFALSKIDEAEELYFEESTNGFSALPYRDEIIMQTESSANDFDEKVKSLQNRFDISEMYITDEWIEFFLSLEVLDKDWRRLLKTIQRRTVMNESTDSTEYARYCERLLVYFIYRYVSVAESFDNLRARLAFSILSVNMIKRIFEAGKEQSLEALIDIARRYSAEIEYSDDNISEIIFELECIL